jgi:hypothetical protein
MSVHMRRAGRATLDGRIELLWSVADGRRGRRWRTRTIVDGTARSTLLLEVDPSGRPTRLELATAAGMLTVHPEEDGRSLHGNVVTPAGMRHLALAWGPDHELDVADDPIAMAIAAHRHRTVVGVGEERSVSAVVVAADLRVTGSQRRLVRLDATGWLVDDGVRAYRLDVDHRGIPVLAGSDEWPLEIRGP